MQKHFNGEVSWSGLTDSKKYDFHTLINQANSIPLTKLFPLYKIGLNEFNRKGKCPLPCHKDSTPSFNYYPKTNTFWCFGCGNGKNPVDLVSKIEEISVFKAAKKIVGLLDGKVFETFATTEAFDKKNELIINFSKSIREKLLNSYSFEDIENVCKTFDDLNNKYNLDDEAISALILKLESCLT